MGSTPGFSQYQPYDPGQVIYIFVIFLLLLSQSWFKIILEQFLVITFQMALTTFHGLNISGSAYNKDKNCFRFGKLVIVIPIAFPHSFLPNPFLRKEKVPYSFQVMLRQGGCLLVDYLYLSNLSISLHLQHHQQLTFVEGLQWARCSTAMILFNPH